MIALLSVYTGVIGFFPSLFPLKDIRLRYAHAAFPTCDIGKRAFSALIGGGRAWTLMAAGGKCPPASFFTEEKRNKIEAMI